MFMVFSVTVNPKWNKNTKNKKYTFKSEQEWGNHLKSNFKQFKDVYAPSKTIYSYSLKISNVGFYKNKKKLCRKISCVFSCFNLKKSGGA